MYAPTFCTTYVGGVCTVFAPTLCTTMAGLNCTVCNNGFYLAGGGYCMACPVGCMTCTSAAVCTLPCSPNYFKSLNLCVQDCGVGNFGDIITGTC